MTKVPRETLTECLDLLEQGLSVDQILSRFPEQSAALRPFLETAVQLSRLAHAPTLEVTRQSREVVLQEVDALRVGHAPGAALWLWLRHSFVPVLSFAVLLLLFAVALPRVSASALPGDSLYGGKRLVEWAQLFLASSPEQHTALQARFNDERIREVEALLTSGRQAEVQFEGEIGEVEPEYWTVARIRVNVSQNTTVEGEPWPGGRALVQGRTQGGRLLATRLVVFGEPPPSPGPTPTMTPTPTLTATPSPTPTATETASPTPTNTLEPVPSFTPAPPMPSPTSDDGGEDDGNENGDDGNENDGDNGDDDDNENGNDGNGDGSQNDDHDENENNFNGNEGDGN